VLVMDACGVARTVFLSPVVFVVFVLGTFLLSAIVYRYFERPAQNMIRSLWIAGVRGVSAPQKVSGTGT
jgi:peptidoglycan/LPS O-acetylase OafA/YrhL